MCFYNCNWTCNGQNYSNLPSLDHNFFYVKCFHDFMLNEDFLLNLQIL